MSPKSATIAVAAMLVLSISTARAQEPQPTPVPAQPAGPREQTPPQTWAGVFGGRRPFNPSRVSHRFDMDVTAAQGYDESVESVDPGAQALQPFSPNQSGHVTTVAGSMNYQVGTSTSFLHMSARSMWSRATTGARDMTIGEGRVQAATPLGKKAGMAVEVRAFYQPTFLFNAFGGMEVTPEAALIGTTPGQGITEQLWRTRVGSTTFDRRWTPRQFTEIAYNVSDRQPVKGVGFDSRSQAASGRHVWNARERAGVDFVVRFDENRQDDVTGPGLPLRYYAGEIGLRLQRRRESFGNAEFRIGLGATHTAFPGSLTRPRAEFTEPAGSGSMRFDFSRAAHLSIEARRSITVLEGMSTEPFNTDAATVRLEGTSFNRLQTILTGAYSHGFSDLSGRSEFETLAGILELRWRASRQVVLFGRGNYYKHHLNDVLMLQPGFPDRYELGAVRAGITFWLPLYGTFRETDAAR